MTTTTPELEKAMANQQLWKAGPVLRAAVELVKAGLAGLDKGVYFFGADDVPESYAYEGKGICGTAMRLLIKGGMVKPSSVHDPDKEIWFGRRTSIRASANGRRVDLYELVNRGLAEAFVMRYDTSYKAKQLEMFGDKP